MAETVAIFLAVLALAAMGAALWLFSDGLRARRAARRYKHAPARRPQEKSEELLVSLAGSTDARGHTSPIRH